MSTEADEIAEAFKKDPITTYDELPLVKTGCDSYASWHPAFKDLSPKIDVDEIVHTAEIERKSHNPFPKNDGSDFWLP